MENSLNDDKNSLIANESTSAIPTNTDSVPNEIPIKKKRGRKRKSEQVKIESSNDEQQFNNEKAETRSSRKRKSVNYLALINPDVSSSENYDFPTNEPKKVRESIKSSKLENIPLEPAHETKNKPKIGNKPMKTEPVSSEDEEDKTIETNSSKVYKRNGNTKEMINTLLSQVEFQNSNEEDTPTKKGQKMKSSPIKPVDADEDQFHDKNIVTCAVCKKEMEKTNWTYHKQRFHNNLAWRIGDTPLDLSNTDLVKHTLNALYNAKKPFYCERCDKAVKSVYGFLSHKTTCGKSTEDAKVPCKYCDKKMLPVSLPSHIRQYHEGNKKVTSTVTKKINEDTPIGSKRKAAVKALKVIKSCNNIKPETHFEDLKFLSSKNAFELIKKSKNQTCKFPNCSSKFLSNNDLVKHLKNCDNKPESGFVCKYCLFVGLTKSSVISHIENVHEIEFEENISEPDETQQDGDVVFNEKKKKYKKKTPMSDRKYPIFIPKNKQQDILFEKAYDWTLELCHKNFSAPLPNDEECFSCLKSNWELMPVETVEKYLPKIGYSCDVGFETVVGFQDVLQKDHSFRKFHLFESYLENNGNSTIFCGGPITAISWLPIPHTENKVLHQIIAITTKNHPDAKYTNDVNYNEKCVIQFWDVGPLRNLDTSMFRPRLKYCLSFDHGPVWDLEWCPSNCYDLFESENSDKFQRLGVLAVAGSDSAIYIYSIPNLKSCGEFYNSRPVLKLVPMAVQESTLGNKQFYASKISWTKAAEHKYIAVGYSNGMVSIYNISNNSKLLLRKDDNDVKTLLPFKSFQAHLHYISAICLHHLDNGCRWLLTGSYDRAVSLWDLNETSTPIQNVRKNLVNDVAWMNNWLCYVVAYDEASTIGQACSAVQQVRDFLSDPLYLFHCSAAITCVAGSDWLNGIIQANAVGEIFATFPKQLMVNLVGKHMKSLRKFLFGFTTLVEKDKSVEERLKVNNEKEKALKNQLKVKTVIKKEELPTDKEVTHLDYNPHYYEYEPLVYHEVESKYGLLFCDHKMTSYTDFPQKMSEDLSYSSKKYASSKPNVYPLQSINKIELNPNRQATSYYVTGYQAGFVRFTCMKFLNKDPQIIADNVKLSNNK